MNRYNRFSTHEQQASDLHFYKTFLFFLNKCSETNMTLLGDLPPQLSEHHTHPQTYNHHKRAALCDACHVIGMPDVL